MRILFLHHYFPGQFAKLAHYFVVQKGYDVIALSSGAVDGRDSEAIEGVKVIHYGTDTPSERLGNSTLASTAEFVRRGWRAAAAANKLKQQGWVPDVIYGHIGWGSGAFLHEVFPAAKTVKYCEWYYRSTGSDVDFLNPPPDFAGRIYTNVENLPLLAELAHADALISPTVWQKDQFPKIFRDRIRIVPDGVDAELFAPNKDVEFDLGNGAVLRSGQRIVTYVARGADPYRGFRQFMEAWSIVQERDAHVQAVIVGDRKIYYASGHGTERHFDDVLSSLNYDVRRTHFTGKLPLRSYLKVLQLSAVHVYLTVPFVMSWSAIEALTTGCLFIGSQTPPVQEYVTHGENGLLCDFKDTQRLAELMLKALDGGDDMYRLRNNARYSIANRHATSHAIKGHEGILRDLMLIS